MSQGLRYLSWCRVSSTNRKTLKPSLRLEPPGRHASDMTNGRAELHLSGDYYVQSLQIMIGERD